MNLNPPIRDMISSAVADPAGPALKRLLDRLKAYGPADPVGLASPALDQVAHTVQKVELVSPYHDRQVLHVYELVADLWCEQRARTCDA